MRTEKEMLDTILNFARNDENIRVVLLNGSRANPNVKKDILQDFDIACLVNDVTPYVRNDDVPAYFGEILILQEPENMQDPPAENNGHYAYLMQFMDGNRIDLSFYPLEQLENVIGDSLTVLLLDKDHLIKDLPASNDSGYLPSIPTEKQFQDCCNEFWWVSPYVAKGLWRDELTYAKSMLEGVLIHEQLLKMLTWYFGIKTSFKKAAGKHGKYLKEELEPELWAELEKTYSDANIENTWEALFTSGRLFRRAAKEVAANFGFQYPQRDDDNVSEYLRRIKNLPKDAAPA
jgi:aminoglycoside 6-adenylyltransferase